MNVKNISKYELSFKEKGAVMNGKRFNLKPISLPITEDQSVISCTHCVPENNDQSFFYPQSVLKEKIVLHFTAGYLESDIRQLTKEKNHVSVPFIISRNGEIYNLWNPDYWSYHLGIGAIGGNEVMSKSSIAIELSNIGYLLKKGNNLVTAYSDSDIYCSLSDAEHYTHLQNGGFRGYEYYASFTKEQYESLIRLLKYLTKRYNIPSSILPEDKRYATLTKSEIMPYKGILSHINFRATEKWDIGPAFNWQKLTNGLI